MNLLKKINCAVECMKKNHAHQRISRNMDPYDASKTKDHVQLQFDRIFWDLINLSVSSSPPPISKKRSTTTKTRKPTGPLPATPPDHNTGNNGCNFLNRAVRYVDALGNPLPPIRKLDDLPNIKEGGWRFGGCFRYVFWGSKYRTSGGVWMSRVFSLLENIPRLKTNMAMYGKSSIFQLEIHRLIHHGFFS